MDKRLLEPYMRPLVAKLKKEHLLQKTHPYNKNKQYMQNEINFPQSLNR